MARTDDSTPNAPDGQLDDQSMPTTDGEMASNTSEELSPPETGPQAERSTE